MTLIEITVDPKFKSLIPPLAPEEFEQLEKNIRQDGCRDPLVVWCRDFDKPPVLIDGHNRHEICTRLGIPFQVHEVTFESEEAAEDWIDANQLGRRNLTPDQQSLLRGRRYNRTKKAVTNATGKNQHSGEVGDQNDHKPNERTAERLAKEHGVSAPTIRRDGQFATAVETLKPLVPDIEVDVARGHAPPKSTVIEAAKVAASGQTEKAIEILTKPHVTNNSGENEWYTPAEYVTAARQAMGTIDLDPASCELANRTVNASRFYTKEDDGLRQEWQGNVWMNPPYGQPLIAQFAERVAVAVEKGEIDQACVLVNNATDTAWFHRMMQNASAVCFTKGRIRFIDKNGNPSGAPLQGQAVVYFGASQKAFEQEFAKFGCVLIKP